MFLWVDFPAMFEDTRSGRVWIVANIPSPKSPNPRCSFIIGIYSSNRQQKIETYMFTKLVVEHKWWLYKWTTEKYNSLEVAE